MKRKIRQTYSTISSKTLFLKKTGYIIDCLSDWYTPWYQFSAQQSLWRKCRLWSVTMNKFRYKPRRFSPNNNDHKRRHNNYSRRHNKVQPVLSLLLPICPEKSTQKFRHKQSISSCIEACRKADERRYIGQLCFVWQNRACFRAVTAKEVTYHNYILKTQTTYLYMIPLILMF